MKREIEVQTKIFDEPYLERLRRGQRETMQDLDHHFRRLLRLKLWGRVKRERVETLADEVITKPLAGIQRGDEPEAACLPNYICGICRELVKKESAAARNDEGTFTRIPVRAVSKDSNCVDPFCARFSALVLIRSPL